MPFKQPGRPDDCVVKDECTMCPDCASLQQQLQHSAPFKRRQAARELANCPDASANLVAQLLCEPDGAVREMIFSSLATLGDAVAVAGMVHCLRSEQAALRNEAIESMKNMPVQVAPIMAGLLNDADPDVRIFAVNILESLSHPNVEPWLIGVIEHDPEVNVCGTAVDLLCELGSEAARAALIQLKARFTDEPYIQFAADLALKRLSTG